MSENRRSLLLYGDQRSVDWHDSIESVKRPIKATLEVREDGKKALVFENGITGYEGWYLSDVQKGVEDVASTPESPVYLCGGSSNYDSLSISRKQLDDIIEKLDSAEDTVWIAEDVLDNIHIVDSQLAKNEEDARKYFIEQVSKNPDVVERHKKSPFFKDVSVYNIMQTPKSEIDNVFSFSQAKRRNRQDYEKQSNLSAAFKDNEARQLTEQAKKKNGLYMVDAVLEYKNSTERGYSGSLLTENTKSRIRFDAFGAAAEKIKKLESGQKVSIGAKIPKGESKVSFRKKIHLLAVHLKEEKQRKNEASQR